VSADLARVPLDLILRNAEEAIGRYQFSVKDQTELMLPTRMSELRHPGRRGHPDRHYARIFQTYVNLIAAGSDAPISELAQAQQVTAHTARKWVAVARHRGLATSVGRGQMGGSLTELGLEALK
jgi:transposase-like protein